MSTPPAGTDTSGSRVRLLHDKTSYSIIPTPPSPTSTSPTLTQSTSNSNSTQSPSPPHPRTPRRSRSRTRARYPDLGRVPLHRRGKSKTYERLEDLLREAGYKETRVFTPEGERGESGSSGEHGVRPNNDQGSMRGGVGAVVGFLAGLIPGAPSVSRSSSVRRAETKEEPPSAEEQMASSSPQTYSPPVSPLTLRQTQKQKRTPISSGPHSPVGMTSSTESLEPTSRVRRWSPVAHHSHTLPPRAQEQQRPIHQLVHRASDQYSYTQQRPRLETRGSRASLQQQLPPPSPSASYVGHPRPSRAGAYLRHMASAPNIPKRNPTQAQSTVQRKALMSDGDVSKFDDPPLPPTWLESVARAVLFGGMGAYVGGPANPPTIIEPAPSSSTSSSSYARTLRPTRSSLSQVSHARLRASRSGLSDRTNTPNSQLSPPELFMRIERGRAGKSTGEVSRTRVVCRSAPASRAGSRVRGGDGSKEKMRVGKEKKGKGGEGRRLPSLASTQVEGDAWARKRDSSGRGGSRYLSGWGVEPESEDDGDAEDRQSSSEDEEELDLARILVPPKRQNSIKSLRKHLAVDDAGSSAAANLMKAASGLRTGHGMSVGSSRTGGSENTRQSIREDDWDGSEAEEWGRGWVKNDKRRNSEDDDDDETYANFLAPGRGGGTKGSGYGSGRTGTGRNRLGLPGPWGLIGGGS
ncbi:hypothetical protein BDZ94DRAFT_1254483 [Collybia nuda]|uniref:Uncharacterized protein n=1 Tax=Collybia nuda TaxID=64659 RepID=A0A9P6CGI4_9AGAR|nr:hypothetical protein BDZ94DRAFT_1254483 [Collybia nuda]